MTGYDFSVALFTIACVFAFVLLIFPAILRAVFWLLDKLFGERR